jgi:hypothetical protein
VTLCAFVRYKGRKEVANREEVGGHKKGSCEQRKEKMHIVISRNVRAKRTETLMSKFWVAFEIVLCRLEQQIWQLRVKWVIPHRQQAKRRLSA